MEKTMDGCLESLRSFRKEGFRYGRLRTCSGRNLISRLILSRAALKTSTLGVLVLLSGCGTYTVRGIHNDNYDLINEMIQDVAVVYKDNTQQYEELQSHLRNNATAITNVANEQAMARGEVPDYSREELIKQLDNDRSEFNTSNSMLIDIRDDLVSLRKGIGWYEGPRHTFQDVLGPAAGVGVGLAVAP